MPTQPPECGLKSFSYSMILHYCLVCYLIIFFQIIPPHDSGIQKSIEENLSPWEDAWDVEKALADPRLTDPLDDISNKYFSKLGSSMLNKEKNQSSPLTFTVTAMHGVSHDYMVEAFKVCGFKVREIFVFCFCYVLS